MHKQTFMKIRPAGPEFYVDGLTEMTKLIAAFRNFANAPNETVQLYTQFVYSSFSAERYIECRPVAASTLNYAELHCITYRTD
jgi:hypothetical protein